MPSVAPICGGHGARQTAAQDYMTVKVLAVGLAIAGQWSLHCARAADGPLRRRRAGCWLGFLPLFLTPPAMTVRLIGPLLTAIGWYSMTHHANCSAQKIFMAWIGLGTAIKPLLGYVHILIKQSECNRITELLNRFESTTDCMCQLCGVPAFTISYQLDLSHESSPEWSI